MKTLKSNQKFKDTPAGRIPVDWVVKRLKDVALVQTGLSLSSSRKLENPVERPYLRVANVQDGHLDLAEVKTTRVEEGNIERYLLKEGDVLFTEGGDFDKLGRGLSHFRSGNVLGTIIFHIYAPNGGREPSPGLEGASPTPWVCPTQIMRPEGAR